MTGATRVAFLTLEDRSDYVIDDDLAIAELGRRGMHAHEVPWARPTDWRIWDGVVVRSTWDYQHEPQRFLAVLAAIGKAGARLANPLDIIRWNVHKSYLVDLEAHGVPVVPTRWGRGLTGRELVELVDSECVLKPVIGANAGDTFRLAPGVALAEADRIAELYVDREWMLQPFVQSVVAEGEHSLFYFGGRFSHSILKTPAPGDFRVQEDHGGTITALDSAGPLRQAADAVLVGLGLCGFDVPVQARVDLVRMPDGSFALLELELIEPSLYLRMDPKAPANFADAVERWLRPQRGAARTGPQSRARG